jgi:diacylglycerol kinase (ATP)
MRARAILNPRAGLASSRAMAAIERAPKSFGRIEIVVTKGPGHARDLGRESAERGDDIVLAIGGDGTANEIAWGLLGHQTALALVPVGSGNGLARTLGLSRDPRLALKQIETGVLKRMDVGFINDRPFLNVAGAGFDALVAQTFQQWGYNGGRRGLLPYVMFSLQQAMKYGEKLRRLEVAGATIEGPAFLVAFANGRQYGGGAIIAPHAFLDDGKLETVHIARLSHAQAIMNVPRLFLGTIGDFEHYRSLSVDCAVLDSPDPVRHHRDGEPEAAELRLDVRVLPRALDVIVPRRTLEGPQNPFLPELGGVDSADPREAPQQSRTAGARILTQ